VGKDTPAWLLTSVRYITSQTKKLDLTEFDLIVAAINEPDMVLARARYVRLFFRPYRVAYLRSRKGSAADIQQSQHQPPCPADDIGDLRHLRATMRKRGHLIESRITTTL